MELVIEGLLCQVLSLAMIKFTNQITASMWRCLNYFMFSANDSNKTSLKQTEYSNGMNRIAITQEVIYTLIKNLSCGLLYSSTVLSTQLPLQMFKVPTKLAQIKAREVISPQNSDASSLPPLCGIRRQMPAVSKQRLCQTNYSENEDVLFPSMMQLLRDNTHAARVHMKHHNIQNNAGQNKNVSYFSVDE
ncbi:Hypothetical_protein [Hexamita inflata]|uniref:Hypothetical_protein n=1 Tax=Hexamita inflata TaxID=28002 RepID=A0AA86QL61_9EUKA|nr:Hypothetical protein HINF_LOCUS41410 [Hexamita inflata]